MSNPVSLELRLLADRLAVCRLAADAAVPPHVLEQPFYSVTRTAEELSLVLPEAAVRPEWRSERGWRMFKVAGPLDFGLVGILANLSQTLAQTGVSIFALSTFDTDYILVKAEKVEKGIEALTAAGHVIVP